MADWIVKKDGEVINTITASEEFAKSYAEKHGYEIEERILPEPEPQPEEPTDYVTWDELAQAYTEGVESVG